MDTVQCVNQNIKKQAYLTCNIFWNDIFDHARWHSKVFLHVKFYFLIMLYSKTPHIPGLLSYHTHKKMQV